MASEERRGVWFAIGAYTVWGLLPIYWKALHNVPAASDPGQPHCLVGRVCRPAADRPAQLGLAAAGAALAAHRAHLCGRGHPAVGQLVHLHLGGQRRLPGGFEPGLLYHAAGQRAAGRAVLSRAAAPGPVGRRRAGGGGRALYHLQLWAAAVDRAVAGLDLWRLRHGQEAGAAAFAAKAWRWRRARFFCRPWPFWSTRRRRATAYWATRIG